MATIVIKDLEESKELDKKALKNLAGGWGICRIICGYLCYYVGWYRVCYRRCYYSCYY